MGTPDGLHHLLHYMWYHMYHPIPLYAPLGIHHMCTPGTPYIDTLSEGLQEGLQNPPNSEIPPVSSYSRSIFRPLRSYGSELHHTLIGYPDTPFSRNAVQQGIPSAGTSFKRYPASRNAVQQHPILEEPRSTGTLVSRNPIQQTPPQTTVYRDRETPLI